MKYIETLLINMALAALVACGGGGGSAGTVAGSNPSTDTTTFTASPSNAVSVAIGNGDKIESTAKEIKYKERFAITVSDTLGQPIRGAKVSIKIEMVGFFKGRLFRDPTTNAVLGDGIVASSSTDNTRIGPSVFCPAEDVNNNDIKDPGEDTNGDGQLTPVKAEIVAVPEGTDITDAQGIVYVTVEYAKAVAGWINYRIVASAAVTGTEGTSKKDLFTTSPAGDEKTPSTPFVFSPYGIQAGCNNKI